MKTIRLTKKPTLICVPLYNMSLQFITTLIIVKSFMPFTIIFSKFDAASLKCALQNHMHIIGQTNRLSWKLLLLTATHQHTHQHTHQLTNENVKGVCAGVHPICLISNTYSSFCTCPNRSLSKSIQSEHLKFC